MRFLSIICLFLLIGTAASAQSLFSSLPKPKVAKANSFARAVTPFDTIPAGQSYVGFRFTGPTVMYATSFKDLKQADLFTFLGVDYEKATFDATSQKYYTDWAIGLHGGAGGQFAPNSVSAVTAVALSLGTQKIGSTKLPFKLTVGVIYNITTHQAMPAVGPGIPLNN